MGDPEAFTWGCREQPPMEELARAIERLSRGSLHMYLPQTGSDEYAAVLSNRELDDAGQEKAWWPGD